jgi:hypothetical protein
VAVTVTNEMATDGGATALTSEAVGLTVVEEADAGGPAAVGRVGDLAAQAVSDTEIELSWSAVADGAGGAAGEYVVAQSLTPMADETDFETAFALCGGVCAFDAAPQSVGDPLGLMVDDLTPGSTYHYAVAPVGADGERGPISASVSATTPGEAPVGGAGEDDGVAEAASAVVRVAGDDRIATAVAASREAFADGTDAVVLARADKFADGLAGVPLARAEDAPLLLTHSDRLDERVASELQRALAGGGRVYLLGGGAALNQAVEQRIAELGFEPVRLAGADRFATAATIAEQGLGAPDRVVFATGEKFPDAVTAGAAAAQSEAAVPLTADDRLPQPTSAYLDRHAPGEQYAVGGPAGAAAPAAQTLAGPTRYETAAATARAFFADPATVGLATGLRFPDALSGGAHVAVYDGPMLLSGPDRLHTAAADYLTQHAAAGAVGVVYGGPAALGPPITEQASAALAGGS